VLGIFLRGLRSALRDASPGAPVALQDAQLGAISFPKRFGSALDAQCHYQVLALDGVISVDVKRGVRFHEATGPDARDAETLSRTVQLPVLRWFVRRGLVDLATAADMRTGRRTGGGFATSMLSVFDGSMDGSVRIEDEDRAGLDLGENERCLTGRMVEERLAEDRRLAELLGVTGTPTYFYKYGAHLGYVDEDRLLELIERSRRAADGPPTPSWP
jgi:hypothetical protein